MAVPGASPEPNQFFLALSCSNTSIIGIEKYLCWPVGYRGMSVWGPTPKPHDILWHCAVQTPPTQGSKNTFAGLWGAMVWGFGAQPQNPNNILWQCGVQLPPSWVSKNTFTGLDVQWYRCLGRHPNSNFFWHCAVQEPHHRYPKSPLVANDVQRYG